MKQLFTILVILFAFWQLAIAQPKPQDTNLVWIDKYQISLANINNIQIAPDGKRVFVSSNDQTSNIRIIDFETGAFLDSIMAKGLLAGFSKDGKYIYTYTEKDIIKLDADTYKEIVHLDSSFDKTGQFDHVKIMSDGKLAASIKFGGTFLFYLIDGESLIIQKKIPQYFDSTFYGSSKSMFNFCISKDGNLMAVAQDFHGSNPDNFKINLWDLDNLKIIKDYPLIDGYSSLTDCQFLPNTNILIISSANKLIFYDYSLKQIIQTLKPINENFVLSDDNKRIYFGSTGGVRIVNLDNYQDICTTVVPSDIGASDIALSGDEKYLLNGHPGYWTLMELKNCLNNVGVKENNLSSDTLIIPNPVKNNINIKLNSYINGNFIYSIVSIAGLTVKTDNIQILNGTGLINVTDLINGTYFLSLYNNKFNFIFKFIVGR